MASLEYQLRMILTEIQILNELGDGDAKPFPYNKRSPYKYDFMMRLGPNEKELTVVDFEDMNEVPGMTNKFGMKLGSNSKCFNVAYKVGNNQFQFKKTQGGIFLRVMATMSLIIQEFIEGINPDLLYIFGTSRYEDTTDDTKKHRLYKVFIWKQLHKIPGYTAQEKGDGYIIFKKQTK